QEDGIRFLHVTGVQTCALPILSTGADWREPIPAATDIRRKNADGDIHEPHGQTGARYGLPLGRPVYADESAGGGSDRTERRHQGTGERRGGGGGRERRVTVVCE